MKTTLFRTCTLVAALLSGLQPARSALTVGDLAIVAYDDTNSVSGDDYYALVATTNIFVGATDEIVYLTNNGWINNSADHRFDGANVSGSGVGDGAENLTKLTFYANTIIAAGTIIRSNDISNSTFGWGTSGSIPMPTGATGTFSAIDLKYDFSAFSERGDQLYIFQASGTENPLLNVSNFIYAMDLGDNNVGGNWSNPYVDAGDHWGGNLPNGLVDNNPTDGGAQYYTVPTVSDQHNGDPEDDSARGFNSIDMWFGGRFSLDLTNSDIITLQTNGGTKAEWLEAINNDGHWATTPTLFDTPLNFVGAVPEPSRALLLALGAVGFVMRRRRD